MPIDYTTTQLLLSVKQRAMNADNQNLFSNDDMIRIASEELQSVVLPAILSMKGEYFVQNIDLPFVNGQVAYTIPSRASGTKLRDVCLVDNQGTEVNLQYVNPEDMKSNWAYSPYQFGFYPQGDQIILVFGNLIGSGNYSFVRMRIYRRPNVLTSTSNAGQILSINTGTSEVTLSFAPPTWTTSTLFDIINSNSPFQARADNQAITNISGFILTFTTLPDNLQVGDWVSEANFSPIPQIPVECHRLLETLTAARILQYSGDPSFQTLQAQSEQQKRELIELINARVDGSPRKLPMRNRLWGRW